MPPLRDWPAAAMWNGGGHMCLKQESVLLSPQAAHAHDQKCCRQKITTPDTMLGNGMLKKRLSNQTLTRGWDVKRVRMTGGGTRRWKKVDHVCVQTWSAATA